MNESHIKGVAGLILATMLFLYGYPLWQQTNHDRPQARPVPGIIAA
jgi:hypothetical protein